MDVIIVGGNECMVCEYREACRRYGCRAKVLVKEKGAMKKKIGSPDLMILFTSTLSHKMALSAIKEARRGDIPLIRSHSSSLRALEQILQEHLSS